MASLPLGLDEMGLDEMGTTWAMRPIVSAAMDVRIGVLHTPKELSLQVEGSADEITGALDKALAGNSVFWLTDAKGRRVGVPAERIAYLEIETDGAMKRVGFGSS